MANDLGARSFAIFQEKAELEKASWEAKLRMRQAWQEHEERAAYYDFVHRPGNRKLKKEAWNKKHLASMRVLKCADEVNDRNRRLDACQAELTRLQQEERKRAACWGLPVYTWPEGWPWRNGASMTGLDPNAVPFIPYASVVPTIVEIIFHPTHPYGAHLDGYLMSNPSEYGTPPTLDGAPPQGCPAETSQVSSGSAVAEGPGIARSQAWFGTAPVCGSSEWLGGGGFAVVDHHASNEAMTVAEGNKKLLAMRQGAPEAEEDDSNHPWRYWTPVHRRVQSTPAPLTAWDAEVLDAGSKTLLDMLHGKTETGAKAKCGTKTDTEAGTDYDYSFPILRKPIPGQGRKDSSPGALEKSKHRVTAKDESQTMNTDESTHVQASEGPHEDGAVTRKERQARRSRDHKGKRSNQRRIDITREILG